MSGDANNKLSDPRLTTKSGENSMNQQKKTTRNAFRYHSKKELMVLQEKKEAKHALTAKATSTGNHNVANVAQQFTEALAERSMKNSSHWMLSQRIKTLLHQSRPVRRGGFSNLSTTKS